LFSSRHIQVLAFAYIATFAMGSMPDKTSLPEADLLKIDNTIALLPPLSRKGHGPGLIIVLPRDAPAYPEGGVLCVDGTPPPLLKWSEEGFAVIEVRGGNIAKPILEKAVKALDDCAKCDVDDGIGIICP
jgi:carboxymethylenebutenolidase